ncbi:MAG: helix-turn-helix domain-containing protein [Opitutales bacterium]
MKAHHPDLQEIGLRLARERIRRKMTQAELAKEAGIGKRTLERLENGESVQLTSFIRVLRELDLADRLTALLPDPQPTPLQLLASAVEQPQRVYKKRKSDAASKKGLWVWGEDR